LVYYVATFIVALFIFERVRPSKAFVKSSYWYARALFFNLTSLAVMWLGYVSWDKWFNEYSVFTLSETLPSPLNGFIAYFIFTFFIYWWHRARHKNKLLWRVFHQIHHSIKRIELVASLYVHPFDMASNLLLGSLVGYLFLGLNFESVAWFNMYMFCMTHFLHSNIRVPRQLGYVLQTPQMHRRHHEYEKHNSNYADIVLWDMIFGTYVNPHEPCEQCGFEGENKILDMLMGKDIY